MGRISFLTTKLSLLLLLAGSLSNVFASSVLPSCGTDTLYDYENNTKFPGGGCAIDALDYILFSYHPISNAPSDTAIEVSQSTLGTGFNFSLVDGKPFTAPVGTVVQFEIDYDIFIDPAPVIPDAKLRVDPPTGDVTITQYFCNDIAYIYSGSCAGTAPQTLSVGTPETRLRESATIVFSKPATTSQGIGILFTLDGTHGASTFDGVDSTSTVLLLGTPEPSSAASLFLGLLTLVGSYKMRKRRDRSL